MKTTVQYSPQIALEKMLFHSKPESPAEGITTVFITCENPHRIDARIPVPAKLSGCIYFGAIGQMPSGDSWREVDHNSIYCAPCVRALLLNEPTPTLNPLWSIGDSVSEPPHGELGSRNPRWN